MLGISLVLLHELLAKRTVAGIVYLIIYFEHLFRSYNFPVFKPPFFLSAANKPILIVLNKTDICSPLIKQMNKNYLQIEELQMQWRNIHVIEGTSLLSCSACSQSVSWLQSILRE